MRRSVPPALARLLKAGRSRISLGASILAGTPRHGNISVYYGRHFRGEPPHVVSGGAVKFHELRKWFPQSSLRFNILYMGSSCMPANWSEAVWLARKKGARFLWNQNGVGYPAWAPQHWSLVNQPMKELLHEADYVVYQSEFCKLSADLQLGKRGNGWEILYNPVDTRAFHPNRRRTPDNQLILLHAGTVEGAYRFEAVVLTLAELVHRGIDVRLIFAGRLIWHHEEKRALTEVRDMISRLGLSERIVLLPPYTRSEAPSVFRGAHILLHTKVYDPCPTVVLEAMASGLPVVYSRDGGVPELVGEDAGIGVESHSTWEETRPPDPVDLADAVIAVAKHLGPYSEAARSRAVEKFEIDLWLRRHRKIFRSMLDG